MAVSEDKIKSGVEGLDKMLNGGLPKNSITLLHGGPGSGKTTLGLQFLMEGAKKGEHGLYIAMEENAEEIVKNAEKIGMDVKKYLEDRIITVHVLRVSRGMKELTATGAGNWLISVKTFGSNAGFSGEMTGESFGSIIKTLVEKAKATRLCLDSLSMFSTQFSENFDLRYETIMLVRLLETTGCACILTSQAAPGGTMLFGPEEYLTHGVINLHYFQSGNSWLQAIQILKMRGTAHDRQMRPYKITDKGIVVYPTENVFGGR